MTTPPLRPEVAQYLAEHPADGKACVRCGRWNIATRDGRFCLRCYWWFQDRIVDGLDGDVIRTKQADDVTDFLRDVFQV